MGEVRVEFIPFTITFDEADVDAYCEQLAVMIQLDYSASANNFGEMGS